MTPATYQAALSTLGLTTTQVADWLGVSVRTAQRYAKTGPCGPAERALRLALAMDRIAGHVPYGDGSEYRTDYQIGHDNAGGYAAEIAREAMK